MAMSGRRCRRCAIVAVFSSSFYPQLSGARGLDVATSCGLVLTRFREPVDWALSLLASGVDVTVLNRGPWSSLDQYISARERARSEHEWLGISPGPGRLRIQNDLANVGREGFAYIAFMVHSARAWEHDITAFCQANPKTKYYSSADLVDDVKRICSRQADRAQPRNPQQRRIAHALGTKGFSYLSRCFPLLQPEAANERKLRSFHAAFYRAFNGSVAEYDALRFCPTSCFAVTRETFLRAYDRKHGTFEELARMLGQSNRPIEAEMIERAWGRLFDLDAADMRQARDEIPGAGSVPISWRRRLRNL